MPIFLRGSPVDRFRARCLVVGYGTRCATTFRRRYGGLTTRVDATLPPIVRWPQPLVAIGRASLMHVMGMRTIHTGGGDCEPQCIELEN